MYSVVYLWLTFRNIWWNKNHKYLLSSTDRLQSSKYKYKYSFQYEYTFDPVDSWGLGQGTEDEEETEN